MNEAMRLTDMSKQSLYDDEQAGRFVIGLHTHSSLSAFLY